jgi:CDP-diacylglycerol---glycerol-3-phosphate 3-phosphatidyltransferase
VMAVLMIAIFSLSYLPNSSSFAPEIVLGSFHIGFNWIDLVCCVIFVIGSVTDAIDGHIARSRNLVTNLGKFMDPLADKFLVDSAFILLATKLDFAGHFQILPFFPVLFIGRDLAMDGLRSIAAANGKVLAANIYGKVKTAIQMGLIPVLFLKGFPFSLLNFSEINVWLGNRFEYTYIITNILVAIALFFSLLSMVIYFIQNKNVLKDSHDGI